MRMFKFIELAFYKIKNKIIGYFEKYFWNPIVQHYKITLSTLLVIIMIPMIVRIFI